MNILILLLAMLAVYLAATLLATRVGVRAYLRPSAAAEADDRIHAPEQTCGYCGTLVGGGALQCVACRADIREVGTKTPFERVVLSRLLPTLILWTGLCFGLPHVVDRYVHSTFVPAERAYYTGDDTGTPPGAPFRAASSRTVVRFVRRPWQDARLPVLSDHVAVLLSQEGKSISLFAPEPNDVILGIDLTTDQFQLLGGRGQETIAEGAITADALADGLNVAYPAHIEFNRSFAQAIVDGLYRFRAGSIMGLDFSSPLLRGHGRRPSASSSVTELLGGWWPRSAARPYARTVHGTAITLWVVGLIVILVRAGRRAPAALTDRAVATSESPTESQKPAADD